ncbi:MAG: penicillin-binding protein 2 [Clostridia bacterium]|nr:penicillin-binding protein 2 [Clostridia bacterium]
MKKRAATVFFLLAVMFAGLGARVLNLSNGALAVASSGTGVRFDIASLRGTIYDCNLKPLTNAEFRYKAIAKPTQKALAALEKELDAETFLAVKEKMLAGEAVCVEVDSDACNGQDITVVAYPRRYTPYACHIIGYCGYDGSGVSGAEKSFDSLLASGNCEITARIGTDANGRVLLGEKAEVQSEGECESGVVLTIDADIQKIVEDALDASGAERAAAMVIDVETGAIKACVSRPLFSQYDVASALDNPDSPLINRAFLPFSVGSVFKPVVAASALENGVDSSFSYVCTGSVNHNGVTFKCHKKDGHGELDMRGALANSCNTYFIALALETGAENIIATAESFGYGKETVLADSIKSKSGNLPETVDSDAAAANLSFGQGELTATPLQICVMTAAIANGGYYVEPYIVEGEVGSDGAFIKKSSYSERRQIIDPETAKQLQSFLETVVEEGSGKRAKTEAVTCAGKTATAQTGKSEGGEEIYNAWFAGYFPAEEPQYAVVILKENGGEGAISCAPVFKEIAENITDLK